MKGDILLLIFIIGVLVVFWYRGGSLAPSALKLPTVNFISPPTTGPRPTGNQPAIQSPNASSWRGKIKLRQGAAAWAQYSNDEYLIIENTAYPGENISVSGWSLTNGKNQKLIAGNKTPPRYGASDRVYLPLAALTYFLNGFNLLQPIVLEPSGQIILTTGWPPRPSAGLVNQSFKVNLCSGYLADSPNAVFSPPLAPRCPQPLDEPGVSALDDDCYEFVRQRRACQTPKFDRTGGSVDGVTGLSRYCRDFLRQHFSYNGCIANHITDDNFYQTEWRVFLFRPFQLWAGNREVITLYDAAGKFVDQLSY